VEREDIELVLARRTETKQPQFGLYLSSFRSRREFMGGSTDAGGMGSHGAIAYLPQRVGVHRVNIRCAIIQAAAKFQIKCH
jgi:hypothetical protein